MTTDPTTKLPTYQAVQLATYMSELSEEAEHASWLTGLEYVLWHAVQTELLQYGRLGISDQIKVTLMRLSDECEGWIVWRGVETWIPMGEWEELYREEEPALVKMLESLRT